MGLLGRSSIFVILICGILIRLTSVGRRGIENYVLASISATGYQGELHNTTTEDGYILGLHRILHKEKDGIIATPVGEKRIPILFIHGLESSAIDWIHYHGKDSLPYLLFEQGYDVWLGNVRGSQVSLNHTSLDPNKDSRMFWDSSFHEIGYYDLPAMIDYVLKESKNEKLLYVGMSQGEATFLVMASMRPEYNKKILLASLASPSSHLRHSDNTVMKTLGAAWPLLQYAARSIGLSNVSSRDLAGTICQYQIFSYACSNVFIPFLGYSHWKQYEPSFIPKIFQVYPVKSAFKQLVHYLQMYSSGIFRRFDYGEEENLKRYGTQEPPEYNMNEVTAPVAYFWGANDCWSRPEDVAEIEKKLPNLVLSYRIPYEGFNHYDILVAKDAKELAYKKIIETIFRYSKSES